MSYIMSPVQFRATVKTRDALYVFTCNAHHSTDAQARLIDPEVYAAYGSHIPAGDHWELELLDLGSDHKPNPENSHVFKKPGNRKTFICFPSQISTEEQAWHVFTAWAVGTAHTLKTGVDFNSLLTMPLDEFPAFMEAAYNVVIIGADRSYRGSINPFVGKKYDSFSLTHV